MSLHGTVNPDLLPFPVVLALGPLNTECWISLNKPSRGGYVWVRTQDRRQGPIKHELGPSPRFRVHRLAYEIYVGPIPAGLVIDHLCKVRGCCNPQHLDLVTQRENSLRGDHPNMVTARTNICKRGHPMDDAYVNPTTGGRDCRACREVRRSKVTA